MLLGATTCMEQILNSMWCSARFLLFCNQSIQLILHIRENVHVFSLRISLNSCNMGGKVEVMKSSIHMTIKNRGCRRDKSVLAFPLFCLLTFSYFFWSHLLAKIECLGGVARQYCWVFPKFTFMNPAWLC